MRTAGLLPRAALLAAVLLLPGPALSEARADEAPLAFVGTGLILGPFAPTPWVPLAMALAIVALGALLWRRRGMPQGRAYGLSMAAAVVLLLGCQTADADRPATPPNIVVLFVDDLGWADLEYAGETYDTPNIDRLAAEGATFTDAYAAAPACSPSRASVVTGRHPARLRLVRHIPNVDAAEGKVPEFHLHPDDPARMPSRNWLPLEETTFAEALGSLGYRSIFIGKWHLGHDPYHPVHQGFDTQRGVSNLGAPASYYPPYFGRASEVYRDVPRDRYLTDQLTDDAVRFLEEYEGEQPFLLTLFYYAVHTPFEGREDLVRRFEADGLSGDAAQRAAMVAAVDESVGRVRAALRAGGFADNTVIVFAGDQGGPLPNDPLRGQKIGGVALYEGGVRIPLIVHGPPVLEPARYSEPVITTDIFPTLVDLAGGDLSDHPHLDGVSLVPLLQPDGDLGRDAIFMYRSYVDQYAAVRQGPWKLVHHRSGRSELYQLGDDLSEENDAAVERPAKLTELRKRLSAWETEMGVSRGSAR